MRQRITRINADSTSLKSTTQYCWYILVKHYWVIVVFQGKWRPASLQWRAQPMGMLRGWWGLAWRWTRHQMDSYIGKIIWNSAFSPLCWFRQPWENPWIMNGIGLLFADMRSQGIGITALSSILQTSKNSASSYIIMQSQHYPQSCQYQRTRIWEIMDNLTALFKLWRPLKFFSSKSLY